MRWCGMPGSSNNYDKVLLLHQLTKQEIRRTEHNNRMPKNRLLTGHSEKERAETQLAQEQRKLEPLENRNKYS